MCMKLCYFPGIMHFFGEGWEDRGVLWGRNQDSVHLPSSNHLGVAAFLRIQEDLDFKNLLPHSQGCFQNSPGYTGSVKHDRVSCCHALTPPSSCQLFSQIAVAHGARSGLVSAHSLTLLETSLLLVSQLCLVIFAYKIVNFSVQFKFVLSWGDLVLTSLKI